MATHANFEAALTDSRKAPFAVVPAQAGRRLRRIIGREQGRALEMLSHAADYLRDGYLQEGAEDEIINVGGPSTEALQMLIQLRQEFLWSLPVAEPWTLRFGNFIFRRKPPLESAPVVTLSASR